MRTTSRSPSRRGRWDAVEASGGAAPARFVRISAQRNNDIGQYVALAGDDPWRGEALDLDDPIQRQWVDTMQPLFEERATRDGPAYPSEVFALDPDAEPGPAQMTYRTGLRPGPAVMQAVAGAYQAVPADVIVALRAAGIRREWTWIEDGSAWTYRECDHLDATEAALAASAPFATWLASMSGFLDERSHLERRRRTREVFRCDRAAAGPRTI